MQLPLDLEDVLSKICRLPVALPDTKEVITYCSSSSFG